MSAAATSMPAASLTVELFTEELPPKALKMLGEAFADGILGGLRDRSFLQSASTATPYATPRRLAVKVTHVLAVSPDQPFTEKLMPASVAFDADDRPTAALRKRLAKLGRAPLADLWPNAVDGPDRLVRESDGKADAIFLYSISKGNSLQNGLQEALDDTIARLPIPKMMTYQRPDGASVKFVRPAHRLLALHGDKIVQVTALGLAAGNTTGGHRFLSRREIVVKTADAYEETLFAEGKVVASFSDRRARIKKQLAELEGALSSELHATLGNPAPMDLGDIRIDLEMSPSETVGAKFPSCLDLGTAERALASGGGADLLDEVTGLVEWPCAYRGRFEDSFLEVPKECLTLTMKQNQKYFPVFTADAELLPYFAIVSNMELSDPSQVIAGNERVIRPRLADARFFFETDKKVPLETRVDPLAAIVFQRTLGSQFLRVERIRILARLIAARLGSSVESADRAALLSKADLSSAMVGEFPELQGVMGRYYALADGEKETVANAIEQHYWPRFSEDRLPDGHTATAVAIADRIDSVVGLFGIGERPTGDKDPFGLRRQSLAVLRILYEHKLALDLHDLILGAVGAYSNEQPYERWTHAILRIEQQHHGRPPSAIGHSKPVFAEGTAADVFSFMLERLRNWLREKGYGYAVVEATLSTQPSRLDDIEDRLCAVRAFGELPEAAALAAANKRIVNILKKSGSDAATAVDRGRLTDGAEQELWLAFQKLDPVVDEHFTRRDYTGALLALAAAKPAVDRFFDEVLVMADDPAVRANRLALLRGVAHTMNRVADISKLAG